MTISNKSTLSFFFVFQILLQTFESFQFAPIQLFEFQVAFNDCIAFASFASTACARVDWMKFNATTITVTIIDVVFMVTGQERTQMSAMSCKIFEYTNDKFQWAWLWINFQSVEYSQVESFVLVSALFFFFFLHDHSMPWRVESEMEWLIIADHWTYVTKILRSHNLKRKLSPFLFPCYNPIVQTKNERRKEEKICFQYFQTYQE